MSLTAALSFPPAPVPPLPPSSSWSRWRAHFERNRHRPLPPTAEAVDLPPAIASELARSLARFQIGETHAHILAGLVSALGGELLRATWTEHTLRALKIPRRELSARLSALVLEGAR